MRPSNYLHRNPPSALRPRIYPDTIFPHQCVGGMPCAPSVTTMAYAPVGALLLARAKINKKHKKGSLDGGRIPIHAGAAS